MAKISDMLFTEEPPVKMEVHPFACCEAAVYGYLTAQFGKEKARKFFKELQEYQATIINDAIMDLIDKGDLDIFKEMKFDETED